MKKGLLYFLTILGFILAVGILLAPQIAGAITYCEGSEPAEDADDYDPTVDIDIETGSVPAALKKFLLDSSYNKTAAAGIMGNIAIESCGYKLRVYNDSCSSFAPDDFVAFKDGHKTFSGGYGLVQWTSNSRVKGLQDYADELNLSVNTLKVQAGYLVKELKSSSYKLLPSKLNSMTLAEVTWIIMRDYETPESVICTSASSSNCKNQASARNISLTTLLNNKATYQSAYDAYTNRLNEAKTAQSITAATGDDPEPVDPTGGEEQPQTPTGSTSGALGVQSSSGYYAQCNASYSSKSWRKTTTTICASGCSLISVANAAKYLGVTPSDPGTLADWTKTVISGESETGWNGSVAKTLSHLGLKNNGYLWTDYNTATSTKIQKIRSTLAAGGVIIAGGDRNRSANPNRQSIDCTSSSNKNAGLCVFSNNGHFIAIIGITADDKLIVANAANGRNGTSSNDKINANNVLKFSNKAIGVYK